MVTNDNEESSMELNNNGFRSDADSEATVTDNSDCESNTSSDDSYDNDDSDEEIDELELQQLKEKISCHNCGRFVS